jgi:hypothetical protein
LKAAYISRIQKAYKRANAQPESTQHICELKIPYPSTAHGDAF